ncbi:MULTISPECIES: succinate dehydrogenase assembly factor 2 [Roseobacteraceae]|jgi:antitoxin CptB|uniref:FAD assembly factor SdhE n=1 Tax=Pseudosulfitobacter pseudonitzschiae TaxID=1402135 RepID=A0A221JXX7_9RHOB|nr:MULTISPECIES: succinate dehydrogenase assembly factor 2 [Roseobacteraceae]ASM71602.1 flavinator of succinate dehydrogenase [Pseudosulfitobacter pseudonitzschiae]
MSEVHEHRLKRLKMRSMRRGIKEMDIILEAYADDTLHLMDDAELTLYDEMLNENDQDLYQWVTGQVAAPPRFSGLIGRISLQFQGSVL